MKTVPNRTKSKSLRFVMLVGDEGAILVYLQGAKVLKRLFAPSSEPANVKGFLDLLASAPNVPITMLVDMMDQSYVRHDLPPVSSLSVNKLVKRRLERDFASDDLKGAIMLGRDKSGRKDWNCLLISLANTPLFSQWMNLIVELPNRFEGVYLVPVEAEQLIPQISKFAQPMRTKDVKTAWQLLVSHNKVGGFRQIVLKDGKLVFTRLAQPIGETTPEVIAGNIEQEVQNTIEYLKRLSYQEAAGLELCLIVSQDIKNVIEPGKFKASAVEIFTPHEIAQALKLEQAALPGDHFGDVVLASFFGTQRKHRLKLHTKYTKKLEALYQASSAMKATAACIAAGLTLWSSTLLYDMYFTRRDIAHLESNKAATERNLELVKGQTKQLPADIDRITDVVAIYELFSKEDRFPLEFITRLSTTTDETVLVKKLKWEAPNTLKTDPATKAKPNEITVNLDLELSRQLTTTQALIQATAAFMQRMKKAFEGYDISYSNLPGTIVESESLQVTFGQGQSQNQNEAILFMAKVTGAGKPPEPPNPSTAAKP